MTVLSFWVTMDTGMCGSEQSMGIHIHIFISGEVLYYDYNAIVSYVLFVNILIK